MQANGRMTKPTVKAITNMKTELSTMGFGKRISKTASGKRLGLMGHDI
jgi:hypothetical protein